MVWFNLDFFGRVVQVGSEMFVLGGEGQVFFFEVRQSFVSVVIQNGR